MKAESILASYLSNLGEEVCSSVGATAQIVPYIQPEKNNIISPCTEQGLIIYALNIVYKLRKR